MIDEEQAIITWVKEKGRARDKEEEEAGGGEEERRG